MKRWFCLLIIVSVLIPSAFAQTSGEFRTDVKDPPYPWTNLNFPDDTGALRFVILSDRTGGHREGVFAKGVRASNLMAPDLVMCVGDLIEGYTEDIAILNKQADEVDGMVAKLNAPFFYVAGNHDISNSVQKKWYIKRYGQRYYHFVYKNVLFLVLYSEGPNDAQIAYTKKVFQDNPEVRWTFVFMHKALFHRDIHKLDFWKKFEPLLKDRPYTVFAGHWHNYQPYTKGGRKYLLLATTGGGSRLSGLENGEFDEIVWVTLRKNDKEPIIANLELNGVLPWDLRPPTSLEYMHHARDGVTFFSEPVFLTDKTGQSISTKLRLTNTGDIPAKLTLDVVAPANSLVKIKDVPQNIPAETTVEVPLSIQFPKTSPRDEMRIACNYTAEYQLEGFKPCKMTHKESVGVVNKYTCPPVKGKITVDGKLDDWPELTIDVSQPKQVQHDPKTHHGPEDGRFRFDVAYDKDYLYIAVETFDDAVSAPAKHVWEQDGVEVRLNAHPMKDRGGAGEWTDALPIVVAPAGEGGEMVIWNPRQLPKGTKVVSVRTPMGHVAEIAVPISYIENLQGKDWKSFRLNVAVDDFDADGGSQLWWKSDWRTPENLPGSGTFERK
ncbi:MAG: metallophosphoesterase [Phycisphaerae bacterium]|nr:metallophosphoesterase [Phycisphaerae bacterium]